MARSFNWLSTTSIMLVALTACAADELPLPADFPNLPVPEVPSPVPPTSPAPDPSPNADVKVPVFISSGNAKFDSWRTKFAQRAANAGHNVGIVHSVLQSVVPIEVIKAQAIGEDQAEFVKPIWDYVASATHPNRVSFGKKKLTETSGLFNTIEARYAPPREILTSIWGMETSYGRILGSSDAVRQLATLAYTGRRTKFGENQLLSTFKLIEQGIVTRDQLKKSSWAGAFGQTQFMPSTFLAHGRDGDGDGRKDVWNSQADALASAGNYLEASGWKRGQPWALEVSLPPNVNYGLADGTKRKVEIWQALGLKIEGGRAANPNLKAELFLPAGSYGPAFLLFDNFYVIKAYNNADSYALSVGLLADKLAGRPELTKAWPTHIKMLSKSQIKEMQAALNSMGYKAGPVDGIAGRGTRGALQSFQKDRNLMADGFPTTQMLSAVKSAARG
ncbi:lytic murein transglycosylase [Hirschia maritima]|uniref:lytic murein transglycosylase n=1 Tax=Hirschia maritima TaxID=1121961 RepID=UPI0003AA77C1|nr:lytic murein transglycosylase [Hirschia maritima]